MIALIGSHSTPALGGVFNGIGRGLCSADVDAMTGALTPADCQALPDPTFLCVSHRRQVVYAASHSVRFEGQPGAGITAFRVGPQGQLEQLNAVRLDHPHATMVSLDPEERFLFAACSLGGAVYGFELAADGGIGRQTGKVSFAGNLIIHPGETPDPQPLPTRPQGWSSAMGVPPMSITRVPRFGDTTMPHCVRATPDGRWLIVADAGASGIGVLGLEQPGGRISMQRRHDLHREASPRMLAMHPGGTIFYSVNERESRVSVYGFDPLTAEVSELQSLDTLPHGYDGPNTASGLALLPGGEFLWSTNRGHDSICAFRIQRDGTLKPAGWTASGGHFPMHAEVTPDGARLYVSNTFSPSIAAFEIQHKTATLRALATCAMPASCCVFLSRQ